MSNKNGVASPKNPYITDEYIVNINKQVRKFCDAWFKQDFTSQATTSIKDPDINPLENKKEPVYDDFEALSDEFNKGIPWLR